MGALASKVHFTVIWATIVVLVGALGGCCFLESDPQLPTIDGPENPQLAASLKGWLLWIEPGEDEVSVMELPSRTVKKVEVNRTPTVLLGVDSGERVLYIDEKDDQSRLRAVPIGGGSSTTIHKFDGVVTTARLDRDCRWLLYNVGYTMEYRELLPSNQIGPSTEISAPDWVDHQVFWAVPGKSIVYQAMGDFRSFCETRLVNLETREVRVLNSDYSHLGYVDPSRRLALVEVGDASKEPISLRTYDLEGNLAGDQWKLPGLMGWIFGASSSGVVAYEAYPTTGTKQESLGWGLTWPRWKWTVKVADPSTGAFETLIPYFDQDPEQAFPVAVLF